VGRNLQDHLWIMGLCFEAKHPLPAPNYNLAGSAGFWKSHPALDRPDLMLLPVQVPWFRTRSPPSTRSRRTPSPSARAWCGRGAEATCV
jgi:hypothetical protein